MYKYVHNTIKNCLLSKSIEKLVYMYCDERALKCIESESYEEKMPTWMYDCNGGNSDNFDARFIICTSTKLEQNLSISTNDLETLLTRLDKKILVRAIPRDARVIPRAEGDTLGHLAYLKE